MSGIVSKNGGRSSGIVGAGAIGADAVDGSNISDDAIDSEHYAAGSIDEAHIADNAVSLAKMAGGTDGTIITFDASGNPSAVGPGTDGQVLTSTGSGSPPAFEAAPSHTGNVAFPATQVASADANTLDDYEEGTWTPTLQDASASDGESQAYSHQSGVYTKIGRHVYVYASYGTSSLGSLSGNIQLGGLPFVVGSVVSPGITGYNAQLALPAAGNGPLTCSCDAGQAGGPYWQSEVTAGVGGVSTTEWSADGRVHIMAHYGI